MNNTLENLKKIYLFLRLRMKKKYNRHVSLGDLLTDRWEKARFLGFGEGSSCYDNVLVLGDVKVGINTWIGPNVILDGSGSLEIGDFCSISAGVQIYTHDSVEWSSSLGCALKTYAQTRIGHGVYIGPQVVIQKGVTIGDRAVIGAMSFVNKDVKPGDTVFGIPARIRE